eukprot:gene12565-15351_t
MRRSLLADWGQSILIWQHSLLKERSVTLHASAIPESFLAKWQTTTDVMAGVFNVPAGLIMRVLPEQIEVLVSSHSDGNPYEADEKAKLNTGLYCETVMATRGLLHVPDALEDEDWRCNPDVALNMISYLGVPLLWPDNQVFGTICVLDNKKRNYGLEGQANYWLNDNWQIGASALAIRSQQKIAKRWQKQDVTAA